MILTFRYEVIALHSVLSTQDQATAFRLPPPGIRKVNAAHECVWSENTSESELVLSTRLTSSSAAQHNQSELNTKRHAFGAGQWLSD